MDSNLRFRHSYIKTPFSLNFYGEDEPIGTNIGLLWEKYSLLDTFSLIIIFW
jgi:hypothetical protein